MELTLADLTLSFLSIVCAASLAQQEAREKEKNRKSYVPQTQRQLTFSWVSHDRVGLTH